MTQRLTPEEKSRRITKKVEEARLSFFERSMVIHKGYYSYDKSVYVNARTKITIICPHHGDFQQVPDSHRRGKGCDKCARDEQRIRQTFSKETFIEKSKAVHGDKYDYSKVDYKTARIKVVIICPIHGEWAIIPDAHIRGNGCRKCGNNKIGDKLRQSLGDFIKRAKKIHGDKYDYSLVEYVNARTNVVIICPEHGPFEKHPDTHINCKAGCPRCSDRWLAESNWLDSLGVPNDTRHRQVTLRMDDGSRIRVDGKINNTVYEFWGTYYHGHPDFNDPDDTTYFNKKFSDLYEYTQKKIDKIETSGYKLIQIWEHEWNENNFLKKSE